jgi:hypothetical protein
MLIMANYLKSNKKNNVFKVGWDEARPLKISTFL